MRRLLHSHWESEQVTASAHSLYPHQEMWPRVSARGPGDAVGPWVGSGPLDRVAGRYVIVAVFRIDEAVLRSAFPEWRLCCEAVLCDDDATGILVAAALLARPPRLNRVGNRQIGRSSCSPGGKLGAQADDDGCNAQVSRSRRLLTPLPNEDGDARRGGAGCAGPVLGAERQESEWVHGSESF